MYVCPRSLHRIFLRSALGFGPLIEPICRLARKVFPQGETLSGAADAMQRAANEYRDSTRAAERAAFDAARDRLAAALVELDANGLFSDLVVADLNGIEAGQRSGLNMIVDAPPPRNLPFLQYVHTVRRNHLVLWTAGR